MSAPRFAVVGGGLAGVTAALDCASAGAEVVLLESRGRLGGAAYSFARDGMYADNGQHVFLRCCTAYVELLERLGAADMVTMQPRLRIPVLAPGGRRAVLRRSNLPAPLHLAGSLLRYRHLNLRDRLAVAWAMNALRRIDVNDPVADGVAFGAWLREHGQSPAAVSALWELIVRPTINLVVDQASLAQAAQVFQEGLLADDAAADIGYAAVPLSEIHDVAARRALAVAGVTVDLRRGVTAIHPTAGGFRIEAGGTPAIEADVVILAVPPDQAARLVPAAAGIDRASVSRLGRSPIVNLHVLYASHVLDEPFAAVVGSPVQWLFDRTASSGVRRGQYLVVTLSAAEAELPLGIEQLRARFVPELAALFGRDARVEKFFVTRDHAATFRAAPGARARRPAPRTALARLLLAGAWTNTGWPATMEGAVRSGHAAAREALACSSGGLIPRPPGVASALAPAASVRTAGLAAGGLR